MVFFGNLWAPSLPTYDGAPFAKNLRSRCDGRQRSAALQHIHKGDNARMPILFRSSEPDGTALAYYVSMSLSIFIAEQFCPFSGLVPPTPTVVPAFYPGLSDPEVIAAMERDITIQWCVHSLILYEGQYN